jgi:hypothetical protein
VRGLRALRLLRDYCEQSGPRSYFGRTLKPTMIQHLCTQVSRLWPSKAPTVFKTTAVGLLNEATTTVLIAQRNGHCLVL